MVEKQARSESSDYIPREFLLRLVRHQQDQSPPAQVGLEVARQAIHRILLPQPAGLQVVQDLPLLKDLPAPDRQLRLPQVLDLVVVHRVVRQEAAQGAQAVQAVQAVAAQCLRTVQTLGSSSAASATSSSSASLTNQKAVSHGVGGSGLSSGAVAGIAIGGAAGLALLGLIAWLIARWAAKQNEAEERPMMHQATEPPVSSEYQMPPNDSNMSFAPSYDAYAQPMQPATYEGQYAGNGYSYRDPVAEAAAGIQHPPQAAQYAPNMSFVPGQPVNAMHQAEALSTDETQPTQRHRPHKKRRDNRVSEWVDADVNPVSDYGADPYRTAGVGSQWTSPEDFDAQVQRTSSGGQNSWPSSNDLASEKYAGDEQLSELDTPSRRRQKRYTNSHGVPREHYADRSQGTYDNSDQYDNDWSHSGMGEENSLSELPYARRRQQRHRSTRDLTPSHDIDLDAEQAVENLRANRRQTYSHRNYF
ncbi:hypothetical protein MPSI1_001030 [Malassezia psittaci]|uniref:Uncharacterized protein n=1 Tax=Malassezia psittaci TaxID=1821823 RepID=A0AAF0JCX2_9BASI|nr:hypothetical protein MPSI1_001030 [Malassezia psittaci]